MALLRTRLLSDIDGLFHGFTTRTGGVSTGTHGPLTLAARDEVAAAELAENWEIALGWLGTGSLDDVAILSQVHGASVVEVVQPRGPLRPQAEADGAWTSQRGVVLAVRIADCVPVLFAAPEGVAVAHAGWRGTALGVVPATVRALCEGTGCAPGSIRAAVGPCISGEAYEVGPEVVEGLVAAGLEPADFIHPVPAGSRPHVDLGRAVEAQLGAAGVGGIERIARCTRTDPDLHSYRRDGPASGRLAGLIARAR